MPSRTARQRLRLVVDGDATGISNEVCWTRWRRVRLLQSNSADRSGEATIRMPSIPTQLSLLPDLATERRVQRTIHYLGSKLRLLDPIRRAVAAVAPGGQPVCDLFSGSGIVSLALASDWDVTSVDIQEYSRVLCNGLANPPKNASDEGLRLCDGASAGSLRSQLRYALCGLLAHERHCVADAADGSADGLSDLLEHGSLLALNRRDDMPRRLRSELNAALDKLNEQDLGHRTGNSCDPPFRRSVLLLGAGHRLGCVAGTGPLPRTVPFGISISLQHWSSLAMP